AGRRRHGPRQLNFSLDNLLKGRLTGLPPPLEAVAYHRDHGAVLIERHHGQRAVGIANALETAQLAGGEVEPQKARYAQGAASLSHGSRRPFLVQRSALEGGPDRPLF